MFRKLMVFAIMIIFSGVSYAQDPDPKLPIERGYDVSSREEFTQLLEWHTVLGSYPGQVITAIDSIVLADSVDVDTTIIYNVWNENTIQFTVTQDSDSLELSVFLLGGYADLTDSTMKWVPIDTLNLPQDTFDSDVDADTSGTNFTFVWEMDIPPVRHLFMIFRGRVGGGANQFIQGWLTRRRY